MQGSANFQAAYVRPWMFHGWDKDMDAADTFNLKITVKDVSLAAKTYQLSQKSNISVGSPMPQEPT